MNSLNLTRMSHKSSTALRYTGTGADFVGFPCPCFAQKQADFAGFDPASPAHLLETRTSTRSPFARDEFCKTCGLSVSPVGRESRFLPLVMKNIEI